MPTKRKDTTLYKTPFSLGYWRCAVAELKDTRMLVFAALIIALRVALKLVYIPLAPNLRINVAFVANALGAMVYGPVVALISAAVSDVLGVMLAGDVYFFPFILTELAGSLIFALFLYRAKVTPTRGHPEPVLHLPVCKHPAPDSHYDAVLSGDDGRKELCAYRTPDSQESVHVPH